MNILKVTPLLIAYFLLLINDIQCGKILGIFYYPGRSHYTTAVTLMTILAERGHEITMVTAIGEKDPPKNYRDVVLPEIWQVISDQMRNYFKLKMHPYIQSYVITTILSPLINATLSHPKLHELMVSEKFDLVIIEHLFSDGLAYIAHYLDLPVVYFSAFSASLMTNPCVGNPASPSYVPDIYLPYSSEMTFFQRLDNTIMYVVNELIRNFVLLPAQNEMVQQNFPGAPDIIEYYQRAKIVLLNGDLSINDPVPRVPGAIDIGGFHIKPVEPLPVDLVDILNTAKNGVVYFSMGSNLKSVDLPSNTRSILLNVFSKLNQTVLWKWEDDQLSQRTDNVVIRKWLPQNDILAHKNVKLFITHGGIHSLLETVYHGVPCLAIPVFIDQKSNAMKIVRFGFGEVIYLEDITEEKLLAVIQELLQNQKYTENAKKRSIIMRDKPMSPSDTLAFWVDYAIRHKGAEHFKVASLKLTWYQHLLLDIAAFTILCLIVVAVTMKYLLKKIKNTFSKESKSKME